MMVRFMTITQAEMSYNVKTFLVSPILNRKIFILQAGQVPFHTLEYLKIGCNIVENIAIATGPAMQIFNDLHCSNISRNVLSLK